MPELPEVEYARRLVEGAVGARIVDVHAPDALWLRRGLDAASLSAALVGTVVSRVDRRGKLLLVEVDDGAAVLGLRFGMTGRIALGDRWAVERLEYGSDRDDPSWVRLSLALSPAGRGRRTLLRVSDPRRLGGAELDPDVSRLGPDAWAVTLPELRSALAGGGGPLKARLLDQARLAGVGNLLADETLWRAGIDPARPAGSLDADEVRRLHRHLRRTIGLLVERGGSHLGDLQVARVRGGRCPRDGAELERRTIGGRTTYSCPDHQW